MWIRIKIFFQICILLINSKSSGYQTFKKTENFLEATGKGPLIKHTKYDKSLFMQTFEQELGMRNIIRVNASTVKSKYWRGNTIFSNK